MAGGRGLAVLYRESDDAILRWEGSERELSGADPATTNNRMELRAVIEGLRALREPCEVDVWTDSRYVVDGMPTNAGSSLDVRDVTLESPRANIGMVLQDTVLFSGTIRENIAYGKDGASDEAVVRAAKAAQATTARRRSAKRTAVDDN